MRSTSPQLKAFLATRPKVVWIADLFTLKLRDGTTTRWSGTDAPVTFSGTTWISIGPTVSRTSWSGKDTTEVPTMEISIASNGTEGASNFKTFVHNGGLDGATFQLDRAIGAAVGVPIGTVTLFAGPVAQIELGSLVAKVTVKGWPVVLQQYMPRNVYQSNCTHVLYDAGCTLDRATFTCTNTVGSGSTSKQIVTAGPWLLPTTVPATMPQLLLGTLTITSGAAEGTSRTVVGGTTSGGGGLALLSYPLYIVPSPGDTLTCSFGCDKTQSTCLNTFNNLQHIRSFPFIPPAEVAV